MRKKYQKIVIWNNWRKCTVKFLKNYLNLVNNFWFWKLPAHLYIIHLSPSILPWTTRRPPATRHSPPSPPATWRPTPWSDSTWRRRSTTPWWTSWCSWCPASSWHSATSWSWSSCTAPRRRGRDSAGQRHRPGPRGRWALGWIDR